MEALSDLNTFAKILIEKGYNGYFHTQGAYGGKLKDSIREYLQYQKDTHSLPKNELLLKGNLQWSGEDKPRVECSLWLKYLNGKFFLDRMEVAKNNRLGQLMAKLELTPHSVITVPKAVDVIALINKVHRRKAGQGPKHFKPAQQKQ